MTALGEQARQQQRKVPSPWGEAPMNKALAFFMGTDCGGGRCEKCEGVFVQPRGMPLNPGITEMVWAFRRRLKAS